jgi:hypothetical protein
LENIANSKVYRNDYCQLEIKNPCCDTRVLKKKV